MSTARYLGWSVPMKQHPGMNDQVIDLHADRPGGGPIVSRNCSSLAVDFGNDIWLFDAADGTLNRLQMSHLKMSNISRMFITHMHADHVLGIVPILKTVMSGIGVSPEQAERTRALGIHKVASFHIYGPRGVRELVRTTLRLTEMGLSGAYAVHELLPADGSPSVTCQAEELHQNEAVGKDIRADELGVWEGILEEGVARGGGRGALARGLSPIEVSSPL
ncbi:hypothetical protein EHS25_002953 [Saitozyma podzolica]|uniref:Metallo-beta-lactamase domain-containing protein n=1 Tax=Saitozyma podzolica TaxID=1890683 RepID=A0A427YCD1_9TREE|nr:hypothetical protein EHS25_002953 [Saitozyma podzolica]